MVPAALTANTGIASRQYSKSAFRYAEQRPFQHHCVHHQSTAQSAACSFFDRAFGRCARQCCRYAYHYRFQLYSHPPIPLAAPLVHWNANGTQTTLTTSACDRHANSSHSRCVSSHLARLAPSSPFLIRPPSPLLLPVASAILTAAAAAPAPALPDLPSPRTLPSFTNCNTIGANSTRRQDLLRSLSLKKHPRSARRPLSSPTPPRKMATRKFSCATLAPAPDRLPAAHRVALCCQRRHCRQRRQQHTFDEHRRPLHRFQFCRHQSGRQHSCRAAKSICATPAPAPPRRARRKPRSISTDDSGSLAGNDNLLPSVSSSGRFVAFLSVTPSKYPAKAAGTPNSGFRQIFVHDTCFGAATSCTPKTTRLSLMPGDSNSLQGKPAGPAISSSAQAVGVSSVRHADALHPHRPRRRLRLPRPNQLQNQQIVLNVVG